MRVIIECNAKNFAKIRWQIVDLINRKDFGGTVEVTDASGNGYSAHGRACPSCAAFKAHRTMRKQRSTERLAVKVTLCGGDHYATCGSHRSTSTMSPEMAAKKAAAKAFGVSASKIKLFGSGLGGITGRYDYIASVEERSAHGR